MIYRSEPQRLDETYSVEFIYGEGRLIVEWSPDLPSRERGAALRPAYIAARDGWLRLLVAALGASVAVVDTGGLA